MGGGEGYWVHPCFVPPDFATTGFNCLWSVAYRWHSLSGLVTGGRLSFTNNLTFRPITSNSNKSSHPPPKLQEKENRTSLFFLHPTPGIVDNVPPSRDSKVQHGEARQRSQEKGWQNRKDEAQGASIAVEIIIPSLVFWNSGQRFDGRFCCMHSGVVWRESVF